MAVVGFLAAVSLGARNDPPVKTQTFTDPAGDNQEDAPDVTGVTVENRADGTLGFTIATPAFTIFNPNNAVSVFLDSDQNRATGQDGSDYLIDMTLGPNYLPATRLYHSIASAPTSSDGIPDNWSGVSSPSLTGEFDPGVGVTFQLNGQELGRGNAFDFRVVTSCFTGYAAGVPGPIYYDNAPDPPAYFTYQLGTTATSSTTTTTTTATQPPPPEKLSGHVGPGRSIALAKHAEQGKAVITIQDHSRTDKFHLTGPGVNDKTGIPFTGSATWKVTLTKGTYTFRSDAHKALHGALVVS